jgi:hypothetical protein
VEIQQLHPGWRDSFLSVALLEEWRKQTDLFTGVQGQLTKVIFLSGRGEPELVQAAASILALVSAICIRPFAPLTSGTS